MNREYKTENGIAQVRYNSQEECLADNSGGTKKFLHSTPCKKARIEGEFVVFKRSKRGGRYILIHLSEYDISYEAIDTEWMSEIDRKEILEFFNPEIVYVLDLIDKRSKERLDFSVRDIKNIYKRTLSRARNIEYLNSFNMEKFDIYLLPEFMKTNSCRTKVFITPNLRSKMGV